MIINDLDDYYIISDTKNRNTELDTLIKKLNLTHKEIVDYLNVICLYLQEEEVTDYGDTIK